MANKQYFLHMAQNVRLLESLLPLNRYHSVVGQII
jgi:hypothetical protein